MTLELYHYESDYSVPKLIGNYYVVNFNETKLSLANASAILKQEKGEECE